MVRLVSLVLSKQNGDMLSPAQENIFLTFWLATTLKQRRFTREINPDIGKRHIQTVLTVRLR